MKDDDNQDDTKLVRWVSVMWLILQHPIRTPILLSQLLDLVGEAVKEFEQMQANHKKNARRVRVRKVK